MTGYASDDTNSLKHLPRRSSKTCDMQFADTDRFMENYSIDVNLFSFILFSKDDRSRLLSTNKDFVIHYCHNYSQAQCLS